MLQEQRGRPGVDAEAGDKRDGDGRWSMVDGERERGRREKAPTISASWCEWPWSVAWAHFILFPIHRILPFSRWSGYSAMRIDGARPSLLILIIAVDERRARCYAMPCHAMPSHPMPCYAMPSHAMPSHAMPCHACHPFSGSRKRDRPRSIRSARTAAPLTPSPAWRHRSPGGEIHGSGSLCMHASVYTC